MKKLRWAIPLFLSLILHLGVLIPPLNKAFFKVFNLTPEVQKPLKIRIVGTETGQKSDLIFIEKKKKKKQITTKSLREKLTLPDLSELESRIKKMTKKKTRSIKPMKAIDKLKITNNEIKDFLKLQSPTQPAPRELLSALDDANVLFDLQVPKGIKEDELNKHEMVFYSFRKRTALAYVNSFYNELNAFERHNPHLRFPLTDSKQKVAGKITYDQNGDILKIETLKWSQIDKLQDFFMDVLKNMSSLPNPPKELVNQEDQFVINFTLTIN
jgi:hypothetical protein